MRAAGREDNPPGLHGFVDSEQLQLPARFAIGGGDGHDAAVAPEALVNPLRRLHEKRVGEIQDDHTHGGGGALAQLTSRCRTHETEGGHGVMNPLASFLTDAFGVVQHVGHRADGYPRRFGDIAH